MVFWYDKAGKPLGDYNEIEKLLRNLDYKRIGRTEVGPYFVSTVWLGLDHDWAHNADKINPRPVIFETMVFESAESHEEPFTLDDGTVMGGYDYHKALDEYIERYCTVEEAKAGHEAVVKQLQEDLK